MRRGKPHSLCSAPCSMVAMRKGLNKKMGDAHENFLVRLLGGRKTISSGNQWRDQMDGRHNSYTSDSAFNFAWDGKSTLTNSISITRSMIYKAEEQAGPEEPLLALRFYRNEELEVDRDFIVVRASVFAEMLELVREHEAEQEDRDS